MKDTSNIFEKVCDFCGEEGSWEFTEIVEGKWDSFGAYHIISDMVICGKCTKGKLKPFLEFNRQHL